MLPYVLLNPKLGNAKRLEECVAYAVDKTPSADDRLKLDQFFTDRDVQSREFWTKQADSVPGIEALYVRIED